MVYCGHLRRFMVRSYICSWLMIFVVIFGGWGLFIVGGCASERGNCCEDNSKSKTVDDFVAIFDDVSLAGWRGLVGSPPDVVKMIAEGRYAEQLVKANERMGQHWWVEDGCIVGDGHGENLCTVANYKNFELVLDWKIEAGGDSGIYLRGSPQVQIWDRPDIGSGGLYNNQKNISTPLVVADKVPGEWNTFRIIMLDDKVTVYLNDQLVVDNVILENYWERDKAIYSEGAIELQAHNSLLRFRNIKVRSIF